MDTRNVFRRLSNKILEDFNISAEINSQGGKGTYRESALTRFLSEGRLPSRYGIGKGEIVGHVHNVSRQSDLIVYDKLNGISLIYDDNTQVFPIECVAGTVEVKSTLNKTKLLESLENIKSVKKLAPRDTVTKTLSGKIRVSYPRSYPFGAIFGYRLGKNSLDSLVKNLEQWEQNTPKEYWPNVIAVLDEGLIQHYGNGLRVVLTNSNLGEAQYSSYIRYEKDTLFKFYSALIDLCASSELGPISLSRYYHQAEQLGEFVVSNHDGFLKDGDDAVFKLSADFVSKVVSFCLRTGGLSQEQLLVRRFGQIPLGMDAKDLQERVFLYNPDKLKGIHEVENPISIQDGNPVAVEGVMEPCHYIVVNGEVYYIPYSYISDNDLQKITGRKKSDL